MASDGWRETTVGVLCDEGVLHTQTGPFGSQLHSYDYVPKGIPVVPTEGIGRRRLLTEGIPEVAEQTAERLSRHRLKSGDILFARRGVQATGLSAIVTPKQEGWICGTGAILLRVLGDSIQPEFLSFLLSSDESVMWLKQHAVGAVMPNLNEGVIRQFPLSIPPLPEQKAIAAVLAALDDKIELNRRMNATLETMARALFQSWFVDFDPVRAKLDGRQLHGLDTVTAALFPEHLEDSPLGHIPKGWEVCSLANKIELLSGGTPKTSEQDYWDGDIPWYSVKDAPSVTDVWVIQTEKQVTKLGIENSAAQVLPEGTTIISARGTVGKLALVGTPMAMNQSCYGVRGAKGYADYFTYFALRQATADLQQRTHGTVFDTITRQTFETLDCIFPPAPLTQAFDRAVAPLLVQVRANLHQSRALATLRDTLLPKLLSRELRVSN